MRKERVEKKVIRNLGLLAFLVGGLHEPASGAAPQVKSAQRARPTRVSGTVKATPGTTYHFPGHAEDLRAGEFWYRGKKIHGSGSQKLGYDLSAVRFDAKRNVWTRLRAGVDVDAYNKNKRNKDWIVYGLPVYAVSDGTVVACWRNAPENPRPGESHPGRTSEPKTIGGGGNFVKIDIGNGQTILNAHFLPNSVPAKICPFNAVLRKDASDKSASTIPEGKRPKIKRGQLLGRVGNSGASSNPHLHIHRQTADNKPLTLNFQSFRYKGAKSKKDVKSAWKKKSNAALPPGKIAVLPNYGPGHAEIARHGVPASQYQHVFDHISGSGYRLDWIDGFDLKGKVFFNVVFRPSKGVAWAAYHNLTGSQYQKKFDERKKKGFAPTHVESFLSGKSVRYAAIFQKKSSPFVAYHGVSAKEHQKKFNSLTKKGWRPRNLSVVSVKGDRFYTALYVKKGSGSLLARSFLTPSQYQKEFKANAKKGRQLVYLNAYLHKGQPRFSALWQAVGKAPFRARHGLTSSAYQKEWQKSLGAGMLTRAVTAYSSSSGKTARFAAVWRK